MVKWNEGLWSDQIMIILLNIGVYLALYQLERSMWMYMLGVWVVFVCLI